MPELRLLLPVCCASPSIGFAGSGPTDALTGLPADPPISTLSAARGSWRIKPSFDVAPDVLLAEQQRQTLVFTIRNVSETYSGSDTDSFKIQIGDRFRINLGDCASTIVQASAVATNIGGSFTTSIDNSNNSVLVTYQGPTPRYFEATQFVKVAITIDTANLAAASCTSLVHAPPGSCGAYYEGLSGWGTFSPALVYGNLVLGCPGDLGLASAGTTGPTGVTGPAGPAGSGATGRPVRWDRKG